MGLSEWPLIIFTVIAQSAIGAYWWSLIVRLSDVLGPEQSLDFDRPMLAVWLLQIASLAIASSHLGMPLRAINAVFRVGRSRFSNEVFFGGGFAALGLLGWILDQFSMEPLWLKMSLQGLIFLFSLSFFFSMIALYRIRTVPTWNSWTTPAAFTVTTLLCGSALASCLFAFFEPVPAGLVLFGPIGLMVFSIFGSLFVTLKQYSSLAKIETAFKRSIDLCPHYAALMAIRFAFLFSALALWSWVFLTGGGPSPTAGLVVFVVVILGEMIGRGIHYQLNMTVGLR